MLIYTRLVYHFLSVCVCMCRARGVCMCVCVCVGLGVCACVCVCVGGGGIVLVQAQLCPHSCASQSLVFNQEHIIERFVGGVWG